MSKLPDLSAIDITPILPEGTSIVKSYSENSITINDKKFDYNIIVSEFDIIKFASFDDIDRLNIDENTIIIFGSKNIEARQEFHEFISKKDPRHMFEIMDLGAACRTFNVLIQESRKVVGIFDVQGS